MLSFKHATVTHGKANERGKPGDLPKKYNLNPGRGSRVALRISFGFRIRQILIVLFEYEVKTQFLSILIFFLLAARAQTYPPAAGHGGSTAIHKDSSVFINWANGCSVIRGYMDISNPVLGHASVGDSSMALGKAGTNGVVSLGDGGWATCTFQWPISNGQGFDFAVFENGFDDYFLELAEVEVSSDGIHFFAFPSHSLTDTLVQKGSFDSLNATKLNNLAGKYRGGYGTPFDLQELQGNANLNIYSITHVRVRDVVGSINNQYSTRDAYHNKINDPWPSPFPSGGFDLDAIGVIYQNTHLPLPEGTHNTQVMVYPNPVQANETLFFELTPTVQQINLVQSLGELIPLSYNQNQIHLPALSPGIYLLEFISKEGKYFKKIVLQN